MKRAEIILNDVQWHYPPELPTKDGHVWAVREFEFFPNEVTEIDYTVKGGWNTFYASDGSLYDRNKLALETLVAWSYDCPYEVKVTDDV